MPTRLHFDLYERLDWVGKLMLDSGRVFAAGGKAVPDEYKARIARHTKPTKTPEV